MLPKCRWRCSIRNDQIKRRGEKKSLGTAGLIKASLWLITKYYGLDQLVEGSQLCPVDQPEFLHHRKTRLICSNYICTIALHYSYGKYRLIRARLIVHLCAIKHSVHPSVGQNIVIARKAWDKSSDLSFFLYILFYRTIVWPQPQASLCVLNDASQLLKPPAKTIGQRRLNHCTKGNPLFFRTWKEGSYFNNQHSVPVVPVAIPNLVCWQAGVLKIF